MNCINIKIFTLERVEYNFEKKQQNSARPTGSFAIVLISVHMQ